MLVQKRKRSIRFATLFLVLLVLVGLAGSAFSQKSAGEFWDASMLANVQMVTDDKMVKNWARISPDGSKLIYNEFASDVLALTDADVAKWMEAEPNTKLDQLAKQVEQSGNLKPDEQKNLQKNYQDALKKEIAARKKEFVRLTKSNTWQDKNKRLWILRKCGYPTANIVLLRNPAQPIKSPLVSGDAHAPSWVDNNIDYLYVSEEDDPPRLVRSSTAGGGKIFITRNPIGVDIGRPSVKDGIIVCDTWINGKRQLVRLKADGTAISKDHEGKDVMYHILGEGAQPSWHPRENKFLYVRTINRTGVRIIEEMDAETLQTHEIYKDTKFNSAYPSYSSCGRYILFQKGIEAGSGKFKGNYWHIFLMKADGSGLTQLTSGAVNAYSPSMDANGNVYFIADAEVTEVYRARANTQNIL